ncbi:HNH nuclease, partial [Salmonella enterica]|nr:HNH nuclease [Salmonella enterica]EDK0230088.1 HNH nuclease [Salmonella enterica]
MRAILTAFPQNGARVTLLKSGNLTNRLRDGQRIMICDVPRQLENTPAGEIPDSGQWLAQDEALQSFFSDSRVINAAGGPEGLSRWVSRIPDCQCAGTGAGGDHVVNLTTA